VTLIINALDVFYEFTRSEARKQDTWKSGQADSLRLIYFGSTFIRGDTRPVRRKIARLASRLLVELDTISGHPSLNGPEVNQVTLLPRLLIWSAQKPCDSRRLRLVTELCANSIQKIRDGSDLYHEGLIGVGPLPEFEKPTRIEPFRRLVRHLMIVVSVLAPVMSIVIALRTLIVK